MHNTFWISSRFTTVFFFFCIYRKSIYLTSRKYSIFTISINFKRTSNVVMIFEFYYYYYHYNINSNRMMTRLGDNYYLNDAVLFFFFWMEKSPMVKLWNWMCTGINYRVHLEINLMDKHDVRARTGADVCAVVQFCWFCETFARYLLFEATRLW